MTKVRLIDTDILHLDKLATITLQEGILSAQNLLSAIATDEDFLKKVTLAFGNVFDAKKLENLRQQWENGNFEGFPAIDIRPAADINGANGAFAKATNKIYLSQEYIVRNTANP